MEINPLRPNLYPAGGIQPGSNPSGPQPAGGFSFQQALDSLGQTQMESDALIQKLAAGEDVDIHQVMIAAEETDIQFRIAMAIRDRLVDSYREVMRMNV
jgi:flagellar hook-basal body complex protein FliE